MKLGTEKSKRKFHRIFFSTDFHASEIVFRKFISAASFYEVDTLVMGGDITGKTVAPVVEDADGKYYFNFQGQEFDQVLANDLQNLEERIMNAGMYPYRVSQSEYETLQADPPKVSALFERLMVERLTRWASLAEENLAPLGVRCYWSGGNDDRQEVLDSVSSTEHFVNVDGKVITLETGHEMLSLGWSNLTPWKTPQECDEDELAAKLGPLTGQVLTPLHLQRACSPVRF